MERLVVLILLAFATPASACKSLKYPPHLLKAEIGRFDTILIVDVKSVEPTDPKAWYPSPFSFKGAIVEILKGPLVLGFTISAKTKGLEGNAGCPIQLDRGGPYLLFLNGSGNDLTVPRFQSYYSREGDGNFASYRRDVLASVGK